MYKRILIGLIALLIASGLLPGALAAPAEFFKSGALLPVTLGSKPKEYTFTVNANGLYNLYLFPSSPDAHAEAELSDGSEILAEGSGTLNLLECRLNADTTYTLTLSGSGSALMEVARNTLSRSFDMPLEPDDDRYSKLIARSGDVHWYKITPDTSGAAIIACTPDTPALRMELQLFSADGMLLTPGEPLASGTSIVSTELTAEAGCYIRVSAQNSATGKYTLNILRSENTEPPESVSLSEASLTLEGRTTANLAPETYPETACPLVYFDTSNPAAAIARRDGWVESRLEGFAMITAYTYGGARSSCKVSVTHVGVESVDLGPDSMLLSEGDKSVLPVILTPDNATDRSLTYETSNPDVIQIQDGLLIAIGEGSATVTVTADGVSASTSVTVTPAQPKYRALFVGEQTYAATVDEQRDGSVKSVESVRALVNSTSFGYATTMLMDASRDVVLASIRRTFAEAREDDVSLMYITCHGFYKAGMTFFIMADGSVLSASDLERELRQIPGQIILLIDCCGSGGVLGEAGTTRQLLEGVTNVFRGAVGSASIHGSKYKVIASARLDQESYRITFGDAGMATVFARALCDAAGWSIDRSSPSSMGADSDFNGEITLDELDSYLSRRVQWYLNLAGDYAQGVCVYPQGDNSVIFKRNE